MYIVKIMKRRDASSVVLAIFIAMALSQWLPSLVGKLSGWLSGVSDTAYYSYSIPGADWKVSYLQPAVFFVLEILVLEAFLRLVVWLHPIFVRKAK